MTLRFFAFPRFIAIGELFPSAAFFLSVTAVPKLAAYRVLGRTTVPLGLLLYGFSSDDGLGTMITLIHYSDGHSQVASLVSLTPGVIRLAIPGCDDTSVFTRRKGRWFSELNEPVQIAFNAADETEHNYVLLLQDLVAPEEESCAAELADDGAYSRLCRRGGLIF